MTDDSYHFRLVSTTTGSPLTAPVGHNSGLVCQVTPVARTRQYSARKQNDRDYYAVPRRLENSKRIGNGTSVLSHLTVAHHRTHSFHTLHRCLPGWASVTGMHANPVLGFRDTVYCTAVAYRCTKLFPKAVAETADIHYLWKSIRIGQKHKV